METNNNPLAAIGLNRRVIRQLSLDIRLFRDFLRRYRKNIALVSHTDTTSVSQAFTGTMNNAFTELEQMDDRELQETIKRFAESEEDFYGVRLDLKKAQEKVDALTQQLSVAGKNNDQLTQSRQEMVRRLTLTLQQLVPRHSNDKRFLTPADLCGYVFANRPIRQCVRLPDSVNPNQNWVKSMESTVIHISAGGIVYQSSVGIKFDQPVSMRLSSWAFTNKVEWFCRSSHPDETWENLGWLIGFADFAIKSEIPKEEVKIDKLIQFLSCDEFRQDIHYSTLFPSSKGGSFGSFLLCLKPIMKPNGISFKIKKIFLNTHSPFQPIKLIKP